MKSIHRIIAASLCLALTVVLISCGKDRGKLPDGFFDERVEENGPDTQNKDTTPDKKEETHTSGNVEGDKPNEEKENTPDKDEKDEKNEDKTIHIIETPTPSFNHSEEEKAVIISRYSEAESFYYDMLCQNFELDNMDTVTLESDGYETVYRRVILEDINSISELKALYGLYFTSAFISKVDFSAYREDGGKLYCAATAGSGLLSAKYNCSVESVDEDSAVVVRSAGGAVQKIKAEKIGDGWFFDGVAMR